MQKWYNRKIFFLSLGSVVVFILLMIFIKAQITASGKNGNSKQNIKIGKVIVEETPAYVKMIRKEVLSPN